MLRVVDLLSILIQNEALFVACTPLLHSFLDKLLRADDLLLQLSGLECLTGVWRWWRRLILDDEITLLPHARTCTLL